MPDMPEKQPTEGYMMRLSDDDDVEGHSSKFKVKAVEDEADVEGHKYKVKAVEDEADVEGHAFNYHGPTSRGE
jgi:hypothetical protein